MDKLYGDIRAFKIRAQEELRRARRYAAFVSLISMDLSHVDGKGDIENFAGLDEFMKSLRQLVRSSIRDTDIIGSSGGKRLLLLLIDTPLEGAEVLSERLQKSIRYFMCNNIKSPLNWRVPMKRYCFPGTPGEEINIQSVLEIIANDQ
jgi:diguanylate cyclase (GGDEF)-like protein